MYQTNFTISKINALFSLKKTLILFFFFVIHYCIGQGSEELLTKADNFFEKKKYTDALKIYEQIFEEKKIASDALLHKLAFIHEGLNNYTEALYYLTLYNEYNPSNKTLKHIEDIAHEHRLKGYTHSDKDFIIVFYKHYGLYILISISLICLYLITIIILKRNQKHKVPKFTFPSIILICFLVFFSFNFTYTNTKAIIIKNQTIIMDSPSAGGKIIDIVSKGHRVELKDKVDIWYKIIWEEEVAYIRENNLRLVNFSYQP